MELVALSTVKAASEGGLPPQANCAVSVALEGSSKRMERKESHLFGANSNKDPKTINLRLLKQGKETNN